MNDKRVKSCLSRFDSGAYSRLQFLRVVSHSVGAHTECLQSRVDSSSSEDEDEASQAPVPAATTSSASKSATAAAHQPLTTAAKLVCFMAPRARVILVPCGHVRFCESSATRVSNMPAAKCPVCRVEITMVMRTFS